MNTFLEDVLHLPVIVTDFRPEKALPLSLATNYSLYRVVISGVECVFVEPKAETNLSAIRKHHKALEKLLEAKCVLFLPQTNQYARERFIEENIPFVINKKQIYLPFIGLALDFKDSRKLKPCYQISFLTQKMLLQSIYEGWHDVSVTQAAEKLDVAKMSITRCYDEIEALKLPYLRRKSRARLFSIADDAKEMWAELQSVLRNPVLQSLGLREVIKADLPLSGLSALGHYSMLGDNSYPIYGITKRNFGKLGLSSSSLASVDETPACVLQELGYEIPFSAGAAMDPLSVALMLTEEELDDPRVEKSVEEMLEDNVWSKV